MIEFLFIWSGSPPLNYVQVFYIYQNFNLTIHHQSHSASLNFKLTLFIQNLFPPISLGPSSKICPKCAPHFLHKVSTRFIHKLPSVLYSILSEVLFANAGHPQPASNFWPLSNNASSQTVQR